MVVAEFGRETEIRRQVHEKKLTQDKMKGKKKTVG
jgi:hypothetical protein